MMKEENCFCDTVMLKNFAQSLEYAARTIYGMASQQDRMREKIDVMEYELDEFKKERQSAH